MRRVPPRERIVEEIVEEGEGRVQLGGMRVSRKPGGTSMTPEDLERENRAIDETFATAAPRFTATSAPLRSSGRTRTAAGATPAG
jgi:hypothetical protein